MRRHLFTFFAALGFLLTTSCCLGQPTTRPAIAPLAAGEEASGSFVVKGIGRIKRERAIGFFVATNGKRKLCSIYDPNDGTPYLLSDGVDTLVYDLSDSRIAHIPASYVQIALKWSPERPRPVSLEFGVYPRDKADHGDPIVQFEVDRFAAQAESLHLTSSTGGDDTFTAERPDHMLNAVQITRGDPSRFRFTSTDAGSGYYKVELEASDVGKDVAPTLLQFPDMKLLSADVQVFEVKENEVASFLTS